MKNLELHHPQAAPAKLKECQKANKLQASKLLNKLRTDLSTKMNKKSRDCKMPKLKKLAG